MLYIPLFLAVDTDDLPQALEAADIYVGGAVDGESTKLVRPANGTQILRAGSFAKVTVPSGPDWE